MQVLSHQQISSVSGGDYPALLQRVIDFYQGDSSNLNKFFSTIGACASGSWACQCICVVTVVAVAVPVTICLGMLGLGIYGVYAASENA